uniref:Uncharacterized protein n=1 Tax=Anopheles culicifacies TaxID=139723 RepID=A0A182LYR6_9DIPT
MTLLLWRKRFVRNRALRSCLDHDLFANALHSGGIGITYWKLECNLLTTPNTPSGDRSISLESSFAVWPKTEEVFSSRGFSTLECLKGRNRAPSSRSLQRVDQLNELRNTNKKHSFRKSRQEAFPTDSELKQSTYQPPRLTYRHQSVRDNERQCVENAHTKCQT